MMKKDKLGGNFEFLFQLFQELKDLKAKYRSGFEEVKAIKSEVQYCQKLVDQCRERLITEFDVW